MTQLLRPNAGFSLIEVLVTLLLTTLGILGMVALQANGVIYTQDSIHRNAAIELSNDLAAIIRAHPGEIVEQAEPPLLSGFKSESLFFKEESGSFSPALPAADSTADACAAPQTAQEQRDCWATRVFAQLPGAAEHLDQMHVCRKSDPASSCDNLGSTIEIQLAWAAKDGTCGAGLDYCTYRTRIDL